MLRSFFLPGQPTKFPRSPIFKIKHSKLELDLDFEKKSLTGKVTHTIEAVGSPIQAITLDAAEMSFESLKVNGAPASYSVGPKSVVIVLGLDLQAGESANVEIEYSATPRRGLYFRGPTEFEPNRTVHAFTQGQSEDSKYWYPCYDYPNMRSSTEMLVTVPQNMTVISNGKLVGVNGTESKNKKTWHFAEEMPHSSYMTSLVAGDFVKLEENHDKVLVQYFLPAYKEALAKRSFEKTPRMIDFFERVTGQKYPYSKYAQSVVSDYMYGGMENISATTLTERTLHDERAHLDFSSDSLVAHELAHQWFGDLLTCKDWSNAWLNEGFATYFDALFKEEDLGEDEFQYFMRHSTAMENFFAETERYQRPIVTKRYWDPDELFDYHTYEKGSWVLNCLRGMLGEDVFFRGIKSYVAKQKISLVETSDFRKALEEVSGIDLESFFEQWLYSPGFPDYFVNYA
ncbi:MAG: M1 family metallopeptidase, partial [Nitrososphaerales archaeon]